MNPTCEIEGKHKVAKKLNDLTKGRFRFKVGTSFDIYDPYYGIYGEMKPEGFGGAAQLLYAYVLEYEKGNIVDAQFFCLLNYTEARFFKAPIFEVLKDFVDKIDLERRFSPSSVSKEFNAEALSILGVHSHINNYNEPLELDVPYIFGKHCNMKSIIMNIFAKYNIDAREFISNNAGVYIEKKDGKITAVLHGGIINNVNGLKTKSKRMW